MSVLVVRDGSSGWLLVMVEATGWLWVSVLVARDSCSTWLSVMVDATGDVGREEVWTLKMRIMQPMIFSNVIYVPTLPPFVLHTNLNFCNSKSLSK